MKLPKVKKFFKEMSTELDHLDQRRREIKNKIIISSGITLVFSLLVVSFFLTLDIDPRLYFLGLFPPLLVFSFIYERHAKPYIEDFKIIVISELVKVVNENLEYEHNRTIDEWTFKSSKIYEKDIDKFKGEDYISGEIGDTKIEFSEIEALEKNESSKGDRWKKVFSGLFFAADFNKHFNSDLIVLNGMKIWKSIKKSMHYNKIEMENSDFEETFDVFGNDEMEARYILTPALMEQILNLNEIVMEKKDALLSSYLSLSFVNSRLFIAIPLNKKLFEPRLFGDSVTTLDDIYEFYGYIEFIIKIVEELNLNTRIWTKK